MACVIRLNLDMKSFLALAAVMLFSAFSISLTGLAAVSPKKPLRWDQFVDKFLDAYFRSRPDFAVNAGRHEFDGQLPDWSPDGLHQSAKMLRQFRERASRFDPAQLNERERLEREFLAARIDGDLFWLERARWPEKNPQFYADIGLGLDPSVYVTPYADHSGCASQPTRKRCLGGRTDPAKPQAPCRAPMSRSARTPLDRWLIS